MSARRYLGAALVTASAAIVPIGGTARRRGSRVPPSLEYGVDAPSDSRDMR
jgi:hypothetical protein